MNTNPGETITIYDIPGILCTTLPKAATTLNITHGLDVAGITPYNHEVFTNVDFYPSYVTDRPEPKNCRRKMINVMQMLTIVAQIKMRQR